MMWGISMERKMYYTMQQNKPSFTSAKVGDKVPARATHFSIAYRYHDTCEILWHTQGWERMGHIVKKIEVD